MSEIPLGRVMLKQDLVQSMVPGFPLGYARLAEIAANDQELTTLREA